MLELDPQIAKAISSEPSAPVVADTQSCASDDARLEQELPVRRRPGGASLRRRHQRVDRRPATQPAGEVIRPR